MTFTGRIIFLDFQSQANQKADILEYGSSLFGYRAYIFFFLTDWVLTTRRQELTSLAKYQAKFLSPKNQK